MELTSKIYCGSTLRDDIRTLVTYCRTEATARTRAKKAGYRARGCALQRIAGWLERIACGSTMLVDLATNVNDCIVCLEQCASDERSDLEQQRRGRKTYKRSEMCHQSRLAMEALAKASAYAEASSVLAQLLKNHHPNLEFPPTLEAGPMSYDELDRYDTPNEKEFGVTSDTEDEEMCMMFESPLVGFSEYEQSVISQVRAVFLQQQMLPTSPMDNTVALFTCLEYLLRNATGYRILVLVGQATLKPNLLSEFKKVTSQGNGNHLLELCRIQERPTVQLQEDTGICVSTLREMQVLLPQPLVEVGQENSLEQEQSKNAPKPTIAPDAFDIIVLYGDVSIHAMPILQRVLEYLQALYHIGLFSQPLDPVLLSLFEQKVAYSELKSEVRA